MKKVLGIDLGTASIGWALVNEAENENEKSSIIKLGVRVNPLTVDEQSNFEKGKSITTNAERTLKRSMRRNLQRYKLRRENLIQILKTVSIISDETILAEHGNKTTFETYRLRAIAAKDKISLEQFGRVLLMINKKRGYKSSRKAKTQDEGQLIDGMSIAKTLYNEGITPGQLVYQLIKEGKKKTPDFYRSDLQNELDKIWEFQLQFYPDILTPAFKDSIRGQGKLNTSKAFLKTYQIYTADNKGSDKKLQAYNLRVNALSLQLTKEELAAVVSDVNGSISSSSGYLGAISDRSKELYFTNQTVGQYLMASLNDKPQLGLKNKVFYRQDYLDEFERLWEAQSQYHKELTNELKNEIRDVIIFYQRRLKSQKGLISFCEFESREIEVEIEGRKKIKIVGTRVCPKSSPLFQEYKIWQILNNIEIRYRVDGTKRLLYQDEKESLFAELSIKDKLKKEDALKLLYKNHKELDLNYQSIEGNRTQAALFAAYQSIIDLSGHGHHDFSKLESTEITDIVETVFSALGYNTDILKFNSALEGNDFEKQPLYRLWHLLYSFEGDDSRTGDEKLLNKLSELYGFNKEHAIIIANTAFQDDYAGLSSKAMRRILPHLKEGIGYDIACLNAGYRHSKESLTKVEIENKLLKDRLNILPKNSLRNPVVEKILNQMINVVNEIAETFGKPDEIRIEMARELKKSAKERESMTSAINKATAEHEKYREILRNEFGLKHISRNDIIRYKLYCELEHRGYKTLYSDTYIPKEKLFSKEFDIEHIIPQSRLFDDSYSNKTLEARDVNIEKGGGTAYDYILDKEGEPGLNEYLSRIENLYKAGKITKTKYNKLKMKGVDIPDDFIDRDLRDSQYIAKKARNILQTLVKTVLPTTGSVTDRLREDWQLIDVMQELNWDKYVKLGLTEIIEGRDGQRIKRIKDWTKRNDHRHHAMDALTIAFTKHNHIQYLNNLNARRDEINSKKKGAIIAIETKELSKTNGKLRFKPPIPLDEFRAIAKLHLENVLVSIKAKNKVVTRNINNTKKKGGTNKKAQLTPRGQLHLETIYGSKQKYVTKFETLGGSFDEKKIMSIAKESHREALLDRIRQFDNDAKKAFTGKNSPSKNPVFLDADQTIKVPEKVKTVFYETIYTIRKEITHELKIEKITDARIRKILETRLEEYGGDKKLAFSNLKENPIWLNKEKGIAIKRVTITGINNALALHDKKDKFGNLILDKNGKKQAVDFVNTGNNHHVAIYKDEKGNLQEEVISFYEATARASQGLPIVDKTHKADEGWQFLFSMKQNEYFVFPNQETGFNPNEIDLLDPENYSLISPNLFRVQKFTIRDYFFRHHLETTVDNNNTSKGLTWLRLGLNGIDNITKVRINHIGMITSFGEY